MLTLIALKRFKTGPITSPTMDYSRVGLGEVLYSRVGLELSAGEGSGGLSRARVILRLVT